MDFLSNLADSFAIEEEPAAASEAEPDEDPGDPIPEFYVPLFHATQALANREIDSDDWLDIWERVGLTLHAIIQQIEAQIQRMGPTFAAHPEALAAGQMLRNGLHQALVALDEMGEFVDDDDVEHLHTGWVDLIKASTMVEKASARFAEVRGRLKSEAPPPEEDAKPPEAPARKGRSKSKPEVARE